MVRAGYSAQQAIEKMYEIYGQLSATKIIIKLEMKRKMAVILNYDNLEINI
jgi:hypothetical protein